MRFYFHPIASIALIASYVTRLLDLFVQSEAAKSYRTGWKGICEKKAIGGEFEEALAL